MARLREHDIPVTFGSDAHDPRRVGEQNEAVRRRLRELGYREWYFFERRTPCPVPL
jgi:histidinol-phosphatase (PHP family)